MTASPDIIDLITQMRKAQKNYFRLRNANALSLLPAALADSKRLEKLVDDQLEIINGTKMDF